MKTSKKILVILLAVLVYLKLRVDDTAGHFTVKGSRRKAAPHAGAADSSDASNEPKKECL